MSEQFDSRYFRGQGPVFLGQRDATTGKPIGLAFIGDISSAELTPQVDAVEVLENVTGSNGVGARFIKATKYDFSMQMRSIKPDHAALAMMGAVTTKAAGSVTDEAVKGYLGKFTFLAHTKISTVVVTNNAGTTTYTAGTDYVLHANVGAIEIPASGSAITAGQDLKIDYVYAAQNHIKAAPGNIQYYLVFAGKNSADNDKQTRCEIYKIQMDPSALGFIQDQTAEMPLKGTVLVDTLRAAGDQFFSWKTED